MNKCNENFGLCQPNCGHAVYERVSLYNNRIQLSAGVFTSAYPDTSVNLDVKFPGLVPYVLIMLLVYITVKTTIHSSRRGHLQHTLCIRSHLLVSWSQQNLFGCDMLIWFPVPNYRRSSPGISCYLLLSSA